MPAVKVNEIKCVGCGICTIFCPAEALGGYGVIKLDPDICTDCLDCVDACPVDALETNL